MKNFLYLILFLLCLVACKKDKVYVSTQPAKGDWLLSKIYQTRITRGTASPRFLNEEFIYNSQKRPLLDIVYQAAGDTTRLDSLFYDEQNRLSRMSGFVYDYRKLRYDYRTKKIFYASDGKIDSIIATDPNLFGVYSMIYKYVYNGSNVKQFVYVGNAARTLSDSVGYSYNGNNLSVVQTFINPAYGDIRSASYHYSGYDDCYNILSYLNMNVYLPFQPSYDLVTYNMNIPIQSKNNARLFVDIPTIDFNGSDLINTYTYQYTKDSIGLIVQKYELSPSSIFSYKYDYEYIPGH